MSAATPVPVVPRLVAGSDAVAAYLLAAYPVVAHLAGRVPGVLVVEDDTVWVQGRHLAEVLAWHERARAGERPPARWAGAVAAVGVMSGSERTRLRLLAAVTAPGVGAVLDVWDLTSLDREGRDFAAAVLGLVVEALQKY